GRHTAVFGPAEDGGYWLIGQRRLRAMPDLFRNVRWSGPHALADTLANLRAGTNHGLVARLADVDDGAAYRRALETTMKAHSPRRGGSVIL
ncbi:MAG: DUF2064 domain-containing protein, partial [Alphaproteobacteria bacterium]